MGIGALLVASVAVAQDNFFLDSIVTSATVIRSDRTAAPGALLTLRAQDTDGGLNVDAFASLEIRHSAYQSYSGFNSVRVGVLAANGLPQNFLEAETTYTVSLTTLGNATDAPYQLFLDYLVFPGAVGLNASAPLNSRAGVSVNIDATNYFKFDADLVGKSGRLEVTKRGIGLDTRIDPLFVAAGTQVGASDIDGFPIQTLESLPFFDSVYLGRYDPFDVAGFSYIMRAFVSVPGYETAGLAMLGDPFALRADPNGELARTFPQGTPPFRIRMVPAAPVPEPGTPALLIAGIACLGLLVSRRTAWRPSP